MYAVEILDGRFCYVHKNRHVDSLRALCTARASVLFRRGSSSVLGTLWRLSGRELQQLADSMADVSPLRQVLWRDLAPLYAQSRLHELLLDRLLLTHDDLRALMRAVEPRVLTRLRIDKIRCMCQDATTEAGWNLGPDEHCIQQRQQDVECLAGLLDRAKSLRWLRTDLPVDVDRMAACGPYPGLEHVGLVWIASPASALHRNSLTVRELRVLLAQMPALRELRCDVSQAIGALDPDAEAMAARLEAAQVTHDSPPPATLLAPFTPALQLLVALCPNLREVVVRASRPRDLVPLGRLRHLERLYISYGGTGMHHFLDESLFEALGDAAANLRHLELPTETYIRPQVFVVRPAWKPVALIDACPALESLVARCFFRRHRPAPANDEHRSDPSKPTAPPATSSRALSCSLREVELMTMVDASALLPLCPDLQRLTLTLSYMNAMEAHAVAELCAEHCPQLQHLTLTVHGGHSHRAVVNFLQRVARIPQVRVFASPGADVFADVNANGQADQQAP